ncbi:TonB-dependent receptor [Rhodospirillales bacterium TMPK1]|uniref:TonB-dependent receptor n=1 Tax=Roseiterribacter gracilis TaxID=2812848 RepID=A0A8S8X801_9PROT|nr:TonB-dependent receptor [Rhodospirillales bacterium TMPK1]
MAAIALLAALCADRAAAQTEEIVVTGTRIARPGITAPNPVTVLNSESIALTGLQSTVDIMSQLPQTQVNLQPSNNQRFTNGIGVSFTNLRGLGEYRTLTLVDGRRHIGSLSGRNGSGGTSLVDTNIIAPGLIDRVEIVTGGTSALYGADAVAGVVNFILKKNYEGAEFTGQYGQSGHGDAKTSTANGLIGQNFGSKRGNITFAFDYNHDTGIVGSDRDYASCGRSLIPNPASFTGTDGIPNNITQACTKSSVFAPNATVRTAVDGNGPLAYTFTPDGSSAIRFNRGTLINPPGTRLGGSIGTTVGAGGAGENTNAQLQLRTPNTRIIADTLVNYELANKLGPLETVNFFADVKYASSRNSATNTGHFNNGAPAATDPFDITNDSAQSALLIKSDNPFIPANFKAIAPGNFSIQRSNYDWSARTGTANYEYFRAVVGFNGTLWNGWKYETYFNYGRNSTNFYNIDRVENRLRQQIDAVRDPATGQIVCRDPAAQAQGCVPINPFKVGSLTPAQYNYAYTLTHENDVLDQKNAVVNLSGDVFKYATPFSGTVAPVGFAAGFEWRRENGNSQPDFLTQSGQLWGNQNAPVVGRYDVREYYAELGVPILRDLPFAKALDVDMAYRFSDYSTSGATNTWNVAVNYAITSDVKLRASTARAVRAPNIDELFSGFGDNFLGYTDPCSSTNINNGPAPANRLANCRALGVPAAYNQNDFTQAPIRTGGNPLLKPEKARTWTAGVVLTPTFVPGFTFIADYWFVKIRDGIQTLSQNAILNNCVDGSGPSPLFCGLITRNRDGSIRTVVAQTVNVGKESVRGVDFDVSYSFDLDRVGLHNMGQLSIQGLATWVPQNTQIAVPGDPTFNLYRSGVVGYPTLKGNIRTTWDYKDLTLSLNARYIGNAETFPNQTPVATGRFEAADFNDIKPFWYFDLGGRYRWNNLTFFAGINNLFDKEPPQVPFLFSGSNQTGASLGNSATGDSASTYSNIGRYFYFGTTVKF